jgi:hypothetical protein
MAAGDLNLIKLCVGIADPGHLARVQKQRLREAAAAGRPRRLAHITRNTPRRTAALLDGGSLYWVIKGRIMVRQRLLGIETGQDEEGRKTCRLLLDETHIMTEPRRHRAFQGWRYLAADEAPPDLPADDGARNLPPELASELRDLGLI